MPLRTIDLCAGIGGIRKGFEMTGQFENVLSAEIDKYACITYEHLYDENPYNDITSTEFKDRVEGIDYEVLLDIGRGYCVKTELYVLNIKI